MHYIPYLCLRCDQETQILGIDDAEMGEFAYDYVGIEPELGIASESSSTINVGVDRNHYHNSKIGAVGGNREPVRLGHHHSQQKQKQRELSTNGGNSSAEENAPGIIA